MDAGRRGGPARGGRQDGAAGLGARAPPLGCSRGRRRRRHGARPRGARAAGPRDGPDMKERPGLLHPDDGHLRVSGRHARLRVVRSVRPAGRGEPVGDARPVSLVGVLGDTGEIPERREGSGARSRRCARTCESSTPPACRSPWGRTCGRFPASAVGRDGLLRARRVAPLAVIRRDRPPPAPRGRRGPRTIARRQARGPAHPEARSSRRHPRTSGPSARSTAGVRVTPPLLGPGCGQRARRVPGPRFARRGPGGSGGSARRSKASPLRRRRQAPR